MRESINAISSNHSSLSVGNDAQAELHYQMHQALLTAQADAV
ncbi:hypothetical protein VFSR5_2049 [Aliivibrio fischeri SR5]|uniref:Uncharacterized protein n=1 Tax=Aliivibrio fischeri SR5 TaxID=1088719 RepID=A0AAV3ETT4_ALIFS|nr:hypothetical protein VFSR5_2049 [Aliivibrio fischeri SR5]